MDILNRLKRFMSSQQITSSQFADTCGIPRPTVSQILSGRNKKISDELIGKIHVGYPRLSVLWLMFGEGQMMMDENIEISEPKNGSKPTFGGTQIPEHNIFEAPRLEFEDVAENSSEKFSAPSSVSQPHFGMPFGPKTEHKAPAVNPLGDNVVSRSDSNESVLKKFAESNVSDKRITSIVVFYADNTFQTFNPSTL